MTAIDYPRLWTPEFERKRGCVCPKCGKRKRGAFERMRDQFIRRMPVNACCCGSSSPCNSASTVTQPPAVVSGTSGPLVFGSCSADGTYSFSGVSGSQWNWVYEDVTGEIDVIIQCDTDFGGTGNSFVSFIAVINFSFGVGGVQYQWFLQNNTYPGVAPFHVVGGVITQTFSLPTYGGPPTPGPCPTSATVILG